MAPKVQPPRTVPAALKKAVCPNCSHLGQWHYPGRDDSSLGPCRACGMFEKSRCEGSAIRKGEFNDFVKAGPALCVCGHPAQTGAKPDPNGSGSYYTHRRTRDTLRMHCTLCEGAGKFPPEDRRGNLTEHHFKVDPKTVDENRTAMFGKATSWRGAGRSLNGACASCEHSRAQHTCGPGSATPECGHDAGQHECVGSGGPQDRKTGDNCLCGQFKTAGIVKASPQTNTAAVAQIKNARANTMGQLRPVAVRPTTTKPTAKSNDKWMLQPKGAKDEGGMTVGDMLAGRSIYAIAKRNVAAAGAQTVKDGFRAEKGKNATTITECPDCGDPYSTKTHDCPMKKSDGMSTCRDCGTESRSNPHDYATPRCNGCGSLQYEIKQEDAPPMQKSHCEDYPACGHGPEPYGDGGGCPDEQGRYRCVLCGDTMPKGATSAICKDCHTSRSRGPEEREARDMYGDDEFDRSMGSFRDFVKGNPLRANLTFKRQKELGYITCPGKDCGMMFPDQQSLTDHLNDPSVRNADDDHPVKKSVVAGTRPFARRALPGVALAQVRAKAPRYRKGGEEGEDISGAPEMEKAQDAQKMTDQEAHDCDHEWQPASEPNLYRCPKGCDYFLRSLKPLDEIRAIQQRKRENLSVKKSTSGVCSVCDANIARDIKGGGKTEGWSHVTSSPHMKNMDHPATPKGRGADFITGPKGTSVDLRSTYAYDKSMHDPELAKGVQIGVPGAEEPRCDGCDHFESAHGDSNGDPKCRNVSGTGTCGCPRFFLRQNQKSFHGHEGALTKGWWSHEHDQGDQEHAHVRQGESTTGWKKSFDEIMAHENGDLDEEGEHAMHQKMVNSGQAWQMQGSYGREAMGHIEAGNIALGHHGHRDYYGNYVPSRHEVQAGTKGSPEYVKARSGRDVDKCTAKNCPHFKEKIPNKLPKKIQKMGKSGGIYLAKSSFDPRQDLIHGLVNALANKKDESGTKFKCDYEGCPGFKRQQKRRLAYHEKYLFLHARTPGGGESCATKARKAARDRGEMFGWRLGI